MVYFTGLEKKLYKNAYKLKRAQTRSRNTAGGITTSSLKSYYRALGIETA